LKDAGAIDQAGFIRFAATMAGLAAARGGTVAADIGNNVDRPDASFVPLVATEAAQPPMPQKPTASQLQAVDDPSLNTWSFRLGEGLVRVQTSHELTPALWRKLNAYVQVLKPSEDEGFGA